MAVTAVHTYVWHLQKYQDAFFGAEKPLMQGEPTFGVFQVLADHCTG